MTKAKQFIQNYKRNYSNVNVGWNDNGEEVTWCSPWLSPDDTLRAVEIEREEMIEKACEWIKEKWDDSYTDPIIIDSVIEHFKKYMKEE